MRVRLVVLLLSVALVILWVACVAWGSIDIEPGVLWSLLSNDATANPVLRYIVLELRVPAAMTAMIAGAALAVAGLLLQTTFGNPLAGPSIMGVSTGASLGAAVALLGGFAAATQLTALVGALAGAMLVIIVLVALAGVVRSSMMLLIVGILLGYLASSAISLLNFFSTQEGVYSYMIWGLGSFTGLSVPQVLILSCVALAAMVGSVMMSKQLDALLLGERYASNLGVNVRRTRAVLLALSGVLTAVVTAYCGPVAFVGLVVPHIARLLAGSVLHRHLLPVTILAGAVTGLLVLLVCNLASDKGSLPVNAITPVIGVPVIVYVILNRKRLNYFN